jgi:hypothetical protein
MIKIKADLFGNEKDCSLNLNHLRVKKKSSRRESPLGSRENLRLSSRKIEAKASGELTLRAISEP